MLKMIPISERNLNHIIVSMKHSKFVKVQENSTNVDHFSKFSCKTNIYKLSLSSTVKSKNSLILRKKHLTKYKTYLTTQVLILKHEYKNGKTFNPEKRQNNLSSCATPPFRNELYMCPDDDKSYHLCRY